MKIAIHKSSWGFSQDWINYCERKGIEFKIVNCYDSYIIEQVADCDLIMWHHHHTIAKDVLFSKQLLYSLQQAGKKVFPDFYTNWHFDDKVGQKYLLEAIGAPFAPTWVFYDKKQALEWIKTTSFPKVIKLRTGAGSANVRLVRTRKQAQNLIKKAFGKGFSTYDKFGDIKEQVRKFKTGKKSYFELIKSIRRLFVSTNFARTIGKQKGYILFQEFLDNNPYDIRVVTIGNRAFAIKRLVRSNDFRASGSGKILYDREEIDEKCVRIAFETTAKLKAQCVAYDFVFGKDKQPLIVEINYGFDHKAYFPCPGYWDDKLNWHAGNFNPAFWIIEELIKSIND